MVAVFEHAKQLKGPVLLHVLTTKGKGYDPAEADQRTFHAVTPFTVEDGKMEKESLRDNLHASLHRKRLNAEAEKPTIKSSPSPPPCQMGRDLAKFQPKFPERYFDVGIAEQHAVTFAAWACRRRVYSRRALFIQHLPTAGL